MTDDRQPDDASAMAAEQALRLLSADERREALAREASDPQFAAEVARWRGRLAPLHDETNAVAPPAGLWSGIEAAITGSVPANDNLAGLRNRLKIWRSATAAMTAIAAGLALSCLSAASGAAARNTGGAARTGRSDGCNAWRQDRDEGGRELGSRRAAACACSGRGHAADPEHRMSCG